MKKLKTILAILMMLGIIIPAFIKMEHHHDQFECNARHEKHYHLKYKQCAVCKFEFPVFSVSKNLGTSIKKVFTDAYHRILCPCGFQDISGFSFLLRAPPRFNNTF